FVPHAMPDHTHACHLGVHSFPPRRSSDLLPGGAASLWQGDCPELGVPVLLLKNDDLYDREGLYLTPDGNEHADNAIRFGALAHADRKSTRLYSSHVKISYAVFCSNKKIST